MKPGDLVMVLQIHDCGKRTDVGPGMLFTVIETAHARAHCPKCGLTREPELVAQLDYMSPGWLPQSWLRRIPPLEELAVELRHTEASL